MARRCSPLLLLLSLFIPPALVSQQQELGTIVGQLRIARGDFPSHQILIELRFRGSPITSMYADSEGKFSFTSLVGGEYHIIINDEGYYPVDQRVILMPDISAIAMERLILQPRETARSADPAASRTAGSNPNLIALGDYNKRFPKKAVKEYEKGLDEERQGRREEAVRHYQSALKMAPDYYPAHNNLGSDYLSRSDFAGAREEFQQVVRLNQSDAAGYFNLSNVCMMMGNLEDAKRYLAEGMRREPDSALGHFLLGSLDMKTGNLAEAESVLKRTVELSPGMPQARLQLVNLYLHEGKKSEAATQLRDFVKLFPESPFAAKANKLLQELESSVVNSGVK
jgi:tetratricopeptide (TPR) repeat protein